MSALYYIIYKISSVVSVSNISEYLNKLAGYILRLVFVKIVYIYYKNDLINIVLCSVLLYKLVYKKTCACMF